MRAFRVAILISCLISFTLSQTYSGEGDDSSTLQGGKIEIDIDTEGDFAALDIESGEEDACASAFGEEAVAVCKAVSSQEPAHYLKLLHRSLKSRCQLHW